MEKILIVQNERGLHLSSAAKIAKLAQSFKCKIQFIKGDVIANAKSVLNITGLMAPSGTAVKMVAEGDDEVEAVKAMEELFNNRFEEP